MFCQRCGRDNPPGTMFCQGCGQQITQQPAGGVQQQAAYGAYAQPNPYYSQGPTNYAGIGRRFVAALIDGLVIGIPISIVSSIFGAMMATRVISRSSRTTYSPDMAVSDVGSFFAGFGFIMVLSIAISWAYFAMMESSSWQGTLGKKVMGVKVTDMNGNRITLGRATGRLLVKAFLSGWFLIGYIIAFFTAKKQSLHDLLAGTLVLTRDPSPQMGYAAPPPNPYQQPQYPPQQQPYQQVTPCPYCGRGVAPGSRYCGSCGRNF